MSLPIFVVNRDGAKSPLNVQRIRDVVEWACKGFNVNPVALEAGLTTRLKDGISTREIQDNLIQHALSMCDLESPDWRYVAGRLHIWSLWKDTLVQRKYSYGGYLKTVIENTKNGIYDTRILETYSYQELEVAGDWIKPHYDLDYDYAGAVLFTKRYLVKNELPQEALLSCALLIASVEQDESQKLPFARQIYQALATRKISLATPILANLRVPNGSLSSCFISAMDDNLESIFDEVKNTARISKSGGGVGINLSRIRATGSTVMGNKNASGGVLPWAKILNDTAIAVNQAGKRSGACTVSLDIWHLDIPEFLECQTENGELRKKTYDVFPQLVISDEFMYRVTHGLNWTLVDPYEVQQVLGYDLPETWNQDGEFTKIYQVIENACNQGVLKLFKVVNAFDLFKTIMKTQVETGLPYLWFKDTVNALNPNKHDGYIPCGNLCVAPETMILTRLGEYPIIDLVGQKIDVWNGEEWSSVIPKKTNIDSKLLRVLISRESITTIDSVADCKKVDFVSIDCTYYHHFYLKDETKISAKDLVSGSELLSFDYPNPDIPYSKVSVKSTVISVEHTGRISDTYCFTEEKRHMGMFNGILTGQCQESYSNVKPGVYSHTCNLHSLNLANIEDSELEVICQIAVRSLDNTIELTKTPFEASQNHNDRYRTIGVGSMALADWLAKRELHYAHENARKEVSKLFEKIAIYTTNASINLAKERGVYPAYCGSEWERGKVLGGRDWAWIEENSAYPELWKSTLENLKTHGIRNSHITAIAPNTSSSLVQGCTPSILPAYSKFHYDKWAKGVVPVAPPFIGDKLWFYPENKHIDQMEVVNMVKVIQDWTDTGISMELVFNLNNPKITAKEIYNVLIHAWKSGCKAVYYIRTVQKDSYSETQECSTCAN